MAIQLKLRSDTAANWTSTNPILKQGEVADEYDTGQFKIGDGTTAWNSLSYQGQTGPTQTLAYRSLGDGADGSVTISSGTTTLSRDMYYNNLTINGTGSLVTANFKVFIKGVLDLTAAPTAAIQNNGNAGGNASGATGGTQPAAQAAGTLGAISQGGSGTTATTAAGTAGGAASAITGNGGGANGAAAGGAGTNAGGAAGGSAVPTVMNICRYETNLLRGVALLSGGGGSGGGGAGGGDGTFAGGGSGAGGSGGGAVAIYANIIYTSSSTPASCIQAVGGTGGNGGNGNASGNTGGGGGGGGGSGGWIYIAYNQRAGPQIIGLLDTSSAMAGNGGNGAGTGVGAKGGSAGNAGTVTLYQIPNANGFNITAVNFFSATTWVPQVGGSNAVGTTGGEGGLGQIFKVTF